MRSMGKNAIKQQELLTTSVLKYKNVSHNPTAATFKKVQNFKKRCCRRDNKKQILHRNKQKK